mmetsp:Transcript_15583/g.23567  ORF Transcript_15583/g.23567 Transcript_15583/m.23567 type:complete len:202 (+) Transcript_15583:35-640(+)
MMLKLLILKNTAIVLLLLLSLIQPSLSFSNNAKFKSRLSPSRLSSSRLHLIDRQSDKSKYGRGVDHISADINEGDVIAYQDGTWFVDGTEVGDGSPATVRYCLVDTVQIVWTHDCEHGLVYGFDLTVADNNDEQVSSDEHGAIIKKGNIFIIQNESYVQCGPEQILCRIPVSSTELESKDVTTQAYASNADFNPIDEIMTA